MNKANAEKINKSHFGLNLGQTAEDSEMFTNIWLSSIGLNMASSFHNDCPRSRFIQNIYIRL